MGAFAKRATQLRTDSYVAWSSLGAAYSLAGRPELAVDAYRTAVELGEFSTTVVLGLADAHIRLGHHQLALNVLANVIRRNPSEMAYERSGYVLFKSRRFRDALASYRAALALDHRHLGALNGIGACFMTLYIQGGRQDPDQRDQALHAWRRSLHVRPEQSRIADLIARYRSL